jgi:hypothetical protein
MNACLKATAVLLLSLLVPGLGKQAHADTGGKALLECPSVVAAKILTNRYPGWSIYSNDPLRLTSADIQVDSGHLESTLDPDEIVNLDDAQLSEIRIFKLAQHRDASGNLLLLCNYGTHAQLSRKLPRDVVECRWVHHRRFDAQGVEFAASCR